MDNPFNRQCPRNDQDYMQNECVHFHPVTLCTSPVQYVQYISMHSVSQTSEGYQSDSSLLHL